MVKIDLGAHIDGFIAQAAHSLVAVDGPAKGRAADVVAAAHAAYEAASRLVRAGRRAKEVGPVLSKIAEAYGCTLVEGVLSHEMKRFIIDASKAVLPRPGVDQKARGGHGGGGGARARAGVRDFMPGSPVLPGRSAHPPACLTSRPHLIHMQSTS